MSDERITFPLAVSMNEEASLTARRREDTTLHLTRAMVEQVDIVQRQNSALDVKRTAVFPEEL